jgi:serine/threonine-protein kinase RsbW
MSENHRIEITMASRVEYVNMLHAATNEVCQILDLDEDTAMNLSLAVHEAAVNAIKHGNGMDATKQVRVCFDITSDELVLEVKDEGSGFELKDVADPLDPGNIGKANGRGIFLIRNFVDRLECTYEPGKGTTVLMMKKLGRNGSKDDKG